MNEDNCTGKTNIKLFTFNYKTIIWVLNIYSWFIYIYFCKYPLIILKCLFVKNSLILLSDHYPKMFKSQTSMNDGWTSYSKLVQWIFFSAEKRNVVKEHNIYLRSDYIITNTKNVVWNRSRRWYDVEFILWFSRFFPWENSENHKISEIL